MSVSSASAPLHPGPPPPRTSDIAGGSGPRSRLRLGDVALAAVKVVLLGALRDRPHHRDDVISAAALAKARATGIAGAIRRRVSGERAGEWVIGAAPHPEQRTP